MKQNVHFQGITLTGAARELAEETLHFNGLERHMKRTVQITVQEIRRRMEALLGETGKEGGAPEAVRCFNLVFNHDAWPETSRDLQQWGEKEMDFLLSYYGPVLRY